MKKITGRMKKMEPGGDYRRDAFPLNRQVT